VEVDRKFRRCPHCGKEGVEKRIMRKKRATERGGGRRRGIFRGVFRGMWARIQGRGRRNRGGVERLVEGGIVNVGVRGGG
jgi:hypothetical protein